MKQPDSSLLATFGGGILWKKAYKTFGENHFTATLLQGVQPNICYSFGWPDTHCKGFQSIKKNKKDNREEDIYLHKKENNIFS